MNPVYFLAPLGLLACALSLAAGLLIQLPAPSMHPLREHAPCTQQVAGPRERWLCSDGHAYDRQDCRWSVAGPLSPSPVHAAF